VETGKISLDISFLPLLSGKIVVEKAEIQDIRANTARETDGKIEQSYAQATSKYFDETTSVLKSETDEFVSPKLAGLQENINVDDIMENIDLVSVTRMDSLKKQLNASYKQWNERLKTLNVEGEIKTIQTEVKKIDINNLDDPVKLQQSLQAADKVRKSVDVLSKTYEKTKNDFQKDYKSTSKDFKNVQEWISQDYAKAMKMAKLPDFSIENIGKMIFGKEMAGQFTTYLGYADMAREFLEPSGDSPPKVQDPPRLKGQNIHFVKRYADPDWWVKEVEISGYPAEGVKLNGHIFDLVSNQRQINKTTDFEASGTGESGGKIALNGTLNYLDSIPEEKFQLAYTGFSLINRKLTSSPYLPGKINAGIGSGLRKKSQGQVHSHDPGITSRHKKS